MRCRCRLTNGNWGKKVKGFQGHIYVSTYILLSAASHAGRGCTSGKNQFWTRTYVCQKQFINPVWVHAGGTGDKKIWGQPTQPLLHGWVFGCDDCVYVVFKEEDYFPAVVRV